MLDDEGDLRAALGDAVRSDQRLERHPSGTWLAHDVPPSQLLEVWQAARRALPVTGRWPVCLWKDDGECHIAVPGEPVEAADRLAAAADATGVAGLASGWVDDQPLTRAEVEPLVSQVFPRHPDLATQVVDALGDPTTAPILDRCLYDRLVEQPSLRAEVDVRELQGAERWFEPEDVVLALLPTGQGWLSPAWLHLFSFEEGARQAALAAVQREWSQECGAELVAHWGTMLQLVVRRPPTDPERAYELAGQIKQVGGSLQTSRYELALALPTSDAWFLHARP